MELRQDFGDAEVGTCLETLLGGNHFRYANCYYASGQGVLIHRLFPFVAVSSVRMDP